MNFKMFRFDVLGELSTPERALREDNRVEIWLVFNYGALKPFKVLFSPRCQTSHNAIIGGLSHSLLLINRRAGFGFVM